MLPGLQDLPSLLRATQPCPSPAGEGCAPSLTLYLLGGRQVAIPGALVATKAALGPYAHVGPPDLDRYTADEWRDPLAFIHPMGTGQRGSEVNQPHPLAQRAEESGLTRLQGHLCAPHTPGHSY